MIFPDLANCNSWSTFFSPNQTYPHKPSTTSVFCHAQCGQLSHYILLHFNCTHTVF